MSHRLGVAVIEMRTASLGKWKRKVEEEKITLHHDVDIIHTRTFPAMLCCVQVSQPLVTENCDPLKLSRFLAR